MRLSDEIKAMAKRVKFDARSADEAWLKKADPRAVQGGAICEDAHSLRVAASKLAAIANELEGNAL